VTGKCEKKTTKSKLVSWKKIHLPIKRKTRETKSKQNYIKFTPNRCISTWTISDSVKLRSQNNTLKTATAVP